jgi:negative regulator of sigma E activity
MPPNTVSARAAYLWWQRKTWRKKKTHGLADAVGLTAAVIAQKDLAAKENAENQTATKAAKATALASAKAKAGKDVSRDPPAPAPASEARIDLTHVSDFKSEVNTGLPSSTAPPRLEDPQNVKRTRGRTLDFVALHTGAPSKKTRA